MIGGSFLTFDFFFPPRFPCSFVLQACSCQFLNVFMAPCDLVQFAEAGSGLHRPVPNTLA